MIFVFRLGLKRLYTDPETLEQDAEEVIEVFGVMLVEAQALKIKKALVLHVDEESHFNFKYRCITTGFDVRKSVVGWRSDGR